VTTVSAVVNRFD